MCIQQGKINSDNREGRTSISSGVTLVPILFARRSDQTKDMRKLQEKQKDYKIFMLNLAAQMKANREKNQCESVYEKNNRKRQKKS